jgi:threonine dehydrogenase-like Zn-dependent dehydrogenase
VSPGTYGFLPTSVAPGLWGAYAEVMYLAPGSIPHRVPPEVPTGVAALFNALAAGFSWAVEAPGLRPGDSVAVLGPGQRGLACVLAACHAGAGTVIVTGMGSRDAHKLALAGDLGADVVVDVEQQDAVDAVAAATAGTGVDVVVDTTPRATQPVIEALRMARPGGTVVLAGLKGTTVPAFPTDEVAMRWQTIKGVRAATTWGFRQAVALIGSETANLQRMHTHRFRLEDAADAVRALSGASDRPAVAVTIEP